VEDEISALEVEGVKTEREVAWLSVVQPADRIDRHEEIVVQALRISIRGDPVVGVVGAGCQNLPRSRAEEVLTRDLRECRDEGIRSNVGEGADVLCVATADVSQMRHSSDTIKRLPRAALRASVQPRHDGRQHRGADG